jgi:hypothetical protein
MPEYGEDGDTSAIPKQDDPGSSGGDVESFLSQSTDEYGAQAGKSSGMLGRSAILVGGGAAILLPASALTIVWLRRRRESAPGTSTSGIGESLTWVRLMRTAPWQAWNSRHTKQPRITRLSKQTQGQIRTLGRQLQVRADQIREPRKVSRWEATGDQFRGNRMTLAALALALSFVGAGRLLDRRASKKPES